MKNVLNLLKVPSCILFIPFFAVLLLLGCEDEFPTDDDDEKTLEAISVPIAIQVLNAAGMDAPDQPENVSVEIDDPAGQLITAARNPIPEAMVLPDGIMSLGLKQGVSYSPDTPYVFTVRAFADGFLENTQTVTITTRVPKYEPVYLVDRNNPPLGTRFSSNVTAFGNNAVVTNTLSIQASVSNESENPADSTLTATITINEGTQLLNKDYSRPIQTDPGEVTVTLGNFNPRYRPAANAFPGGALVYNAVDASGENLATPSNPFVFATYGYLNVEMRVGEEEVGGFEGELPEVSMEVASDFINPGTGNPVQAQDIIPIWSLNSKTGQWVKEADISIVEVEGKLMANFKIPHLSYWNLDSRTGKCDNPVVINLDNSENPFRVRYIDLVDDGGAIVTPFRNTAGNVFHLPAGATTSFDIINTPPATDFGIQVHQTFQESSAVVLTETFSTCATEPDAIPAVNVDLPDDGGNCRQLVFEITCPGTGECLFLPSSVALWVSVNSGTQMLAGFFDGLGRVDFDLTNIDAGDDLDFIIWYDADNTPATTAGEQISISTTGDLTDDGDPLVQSISTGPNPGGNCTQRVIFAIETGFTCAGSNFASFIDADCDPST